MKRSDTFTWNGSRLKWSSESWPHFTNKDEKVRDFYAKVSPVGTAWRGYLQVNGMHHDGPETEGTPGDALDACHRAMFATLENALGKPVKP